MTSEQRPTVNNGHYFWVPRVVVVHRFDYIFGYFCCLSINTNSNFVDKTADKIEKNIIIMM
jgi:hypothetical protein